MYIYTYVHMYIRVYILTCSLQIVAQIIWYFNVPVLTGYRAGVSTRKALSLCNMHDARNCSSSPCHSCQSNNHMLPHHRKSVQEPNPPENQVPGSSHMISQRSSIMAVSSSASPSVSLSVSRQPLSSQYSVEPVLLATAVVLIKNRAGKYVPCRTLLGSGSQVHLITTRFANQLQLRKTKSLTAITGISWHHLKVSYITFYQ